MRSLRTGHLFLTVLAKIGASDDLEAVNEALENEKENRVRRKLERSLRALKSQRAA